MGFDSSIMEEGGPVRVEYPRRTFDPQHAPVRLFEFDSADDPTINPKRQPFVIMCSREHYPELRLYFAQRLSAFVTRINQGRFRSPYLRWDDRAVNPRNERFRDVLDGRYGAETDLFVIPIRKASGANRWVPEGGVKFVRRSWGGRPRMLAKGTVNLIMGDGGIEHDALCIDAYYGGGGGSDIGALKEGL